MNRAGLLMTFLTIAIRFTIAAALVTPLKAFAEPHDGSRIAELAYAGGVTIELSGLGGLIGYGASPSPSLVQDAQIDRLAEAVDDLLPEWIEDTLSNSAGLMFSRERANCFKRSARYTSAPEFLGDAFGQARYRLNFRDDISTLMIGWAF